MALVDAEDGLTVTTRDFPTNAGGLCRKGWTSTTLLTHPERLQTPLIRDRRDGPLREATWAEAIARTATALTDAQRTYGRSAAGVFGGGGLTNEKAYLLGKFARVGLQTPSIDYNGRFCMSSAAAAGIRAFGLDRGLPFPLEDIPLAEVVVLVGANPAETMPPAMRFLDEQRRRGGQLIVIDPRATSTARAATLHLAPAPGTDLALANGLLHILVRERMLDREYIHERTTGFGGVLQAVATYWPDRVERITGVPAEDIRRAALMVGQAATAMVLTARGSEQHSNGTETVLAFINLILATGRAGRPGSGYGCITGQGNGQGGREHGQKADQLPGYRRIDDPAARAHVAAIWGVDPDELPGPGPSAYELLDGLGTPGGVRALLVMGSNPVVSSPNAGHIQAHRRTRLPGRRRPLPVRDRRPRRRGLPLDPVGRGGRNHDEPGGPCPPATPGGRTTGGCAERYRDPREPRPRDRPGASLHHHRTARDLRRVATCERGRTRGLLGDHV